MALFVLRSFCASLQHDITNKLIFVGLSLVPIHTYITAVPILPIVIRSELQSAAVDAVAARLRKCHFIMATCDGCNCESSEIILYVTHNIVKYSLLLDHYVVIERSSCVMIICFALSGLVIATKYFNPTTLY